MGQTYQAHKIVDNLYQGGYPPPGPFLKRAGVDVLVLCAMEWQDPGGRNYPGLTVINAGGDDDTRLHRVMPYMGLWQHAARLVVGHLRDGKKVLVTCMQGMNRSGMVTSHVLRELTGMSGHDIVTLVQDKRPGSLFNPTFVKYIEEKFQ
jgi:hypothetical protein